ncbi:MAG: UDP-N-acetylmuramate--L-alanine ligase [Clostridia bacterium]|nr:UDP-N-acetylmuramate--L-alanine ligase [Clostridia bacterium]
MNLEISDLKKYKHIHLIGIGGISMSAIAETLKNWNFVVTGSDLNQSIITDTLNKHGIKTTIGHDLENPGKADLIVYSAAISDNDPEIIIAKENNIPLVDRGEFVGHLTKLYQETICVSGTHGKTTTTSMLSYCFINAHKDPSIEVGAILDLINGNYRVGNSEYFILESCEYKGNFLKFFPHTEIILNIDNDHLDYYKTFDNVIKTFQDFAKLLPENGLLVTNADDKNCLNLKDITKGKFISYGIENDNADYLAKNISYDSNGFAKFDVYKNKEFFTTIELSVAGKHNILNALACICVSDYYGIEKNIICESLKQFRGAERRLEYKGTLEKNINIFDDYAHHPTEIKATANAIKNKKYNKSWVIFQPHTYSRTKLLLEDFAEAISNFDNIILLDIYAAREQNTYNINSKDLAEAIKSHGKTVAYIPDFEKVVSYVKENVKENDIIITLGAGTVTKLGPMILNNQ